MLLWTTASAAQVAASPPKDEATENERDDKDDDKAPGLIHGPQLRLSAEIATINYADLAKGTSRGPGTAVQYYHDETRKTFGWGGRVGLGYALVVGGSWGFVPRGTFSITRGSEQRHTRENLLTPIDVTTRAHFLTGTGGVEIQFPGRFLVLDLGIGISATMNRVRSASPSALEVDSESFTGPLGRFGAGFLFPPWFPLNAGILGSVEGSISKGYRGYMTRAGLAFFVQWDGSR